MGLNDFKYSWRFTDINYAVFSERELSEIRNIPASSFDTVVLYYAIGHLSHIAEPVLWECHRVAGERGIVCIVSSFRMDKAIIRETILPLLAQMGLPFVARSYKEFEYVRIGRNAETEDP